MNSSVTSVNLTQEQIDFLLSPRAIRERAAQIFERTANGHGHFRIHMEKLPETVDFVLETIRSNYPDLNIPVHSRWNHFRVGGVDRVAGLDKIIKEFDPLEKARIKFDLVITSVLLDAGAGPEWAYREAQTNSSYSRSEGLGVASYHLFLSGALSSDGKSLRADEEGLTRFGVGDLERSFQVDAKNPLVGLSGRVTLLNNLGRATGDRRFFGSGRPGALVDTLREKFGSQIPASGVLRTVLDGLGSIWLGRLSASGINLGDVWIYPGLAPAGSFESLVPIHKLSQWLTYSLLEPLMEAGFEIVGVDELTGLAEYRNGGLLVDSGLISPRDPEVSERAWPPSSEVVIEWRALTIHLLDEIGRQVQQALGRTSAEFPLAKVLEGGTWWAGRNLARQRRAGGVPPIEIQSDGTVF